MVCCRTAFFLSFLFFRSFDLFVLSFLFFSFFRSYFLSDIHSDLSFAAYQYQLHGYITNSMIVVNILHAFYVIDFFINEDWFVASPRTRGSADSE